MHVLIYNFIISRYYKVWCVVTIYRPSSTALEFFARANLEKCKTQVQNFSLDKPLANFDPFLDENAFKFHEFAKYTDYVN